MKKFFHILYQPYKFLILMPLIAINTAAMGFLVVLLSFLFKPGIANFPAVVWARIIGFLTPMFLKVTGRENINRKQSYVIVVNHQSVFDIVVLYGWLGVDFKWVMKLEIRKIPVVGYACKRLEHIYIDRSDTAAAIKSIEDAKDRIVNGTSVVFFPEGTRSRDGKLIKFKKGAFKFAMDLGIPILPITLKDTNKIQPNKTIDIFPGRADMIIHAPVDISVYNDKNVKDLMEKVKGIIGSAL